MKFIHTSDLHIGKKIYNYSLMEEQEFILNQIIENALKENAEGVFLVGDIYDKSIPSEESHTMFSKFIETCCEKEIKVFVIAGNHDSGKRLETFKNIVRANNIFIEGEYRGKLAKFSLRDQFGPLNIYMLPYINERRIRQYFPDEKYENSEEALAAVLSRENINKEERNILLLHQYVRGGLTCQSEEFAIGGEHEINGYLLRDFDYVALGHLHNSQKAGRREIRYSGSPIKYSFSEINYIKSMTLLDFKEKGNIEISTIPYISKRNMIEIKDSLENIINHKYSDYKNDFVNIILTKEQEEANAYKLLKELFPYITSISYEGNDSEDYILSFPSEDKIENPIDVFKELYLRQKDEELTSDQLSVLKNIMKNIEEGRDIDYEDS